MNSEPVIRIENLSRCFGSKIALHNITLDVPTGIVMGLIGENGAGKTTLIKHILGLLKTQSGTVRVFGKDPVSDPVGVLSKIGYLSEESDLLLEGRTVMHAPEIDGKVFVNDVREDVTPAFGQFYRCQITESHDYDLVAKIV